MGETLQAFSSPSRASCPGRFGRGVLSDLALKEMALCRHGGECMGSVLVCVCACVCVRVCVRACICVLRACVCACVCAKYRGKMFPCPAVK